MSRGHRERHVADERRRRVGRERSLLLDLLRERRPGDELEGDHGDPLDELGAEDRDDARVTDPRGGAGLAQEALARLLVLLAEEELERDLAAEALVRGAVDGSLPAAAELGLDPVAPESRAGLEDARSSRPGSRLLPGEGDRLARLPDLVEERAGLLAREEPPLAEGAGERALPGLPHDLVERLLGDEPPLEDERDELLVSRGREVGLGHGPSVTGSHVAGKSGWIEDLVEVHPENARPPEGERHERQEDRAREDREEPVVAPREEEDEGDRDGAYERARDRVAEVHGAEVVTRLAVKREPAAGTRRPHGERALEDDALEAARATLAEHGLGAGEDVAHEIVLLRLGVLAT